MNKTILTVLLGLAMGILFTFSKGIAIMLGVIIITGVALKIFLPESDRGFLVTLFISGISARIALLSIIYIILISQGRYVAITPDSRLYFLKALDIMRFWMGQTQFSLQVQAEVGRSSHLYILSLFYLLIGYNPVILYPVSIFSDKLINCLIGTLSGIPIFYIAKDIFGKKVAKISTILVVFFPTLVFWSITNAREPINILLVCLIMLSIVRLQKERKPGYFILLGISLLVLRTIRPYIFIPVLTIVAVSFLIIAGKNFRRKILTLFLVLIMTLLFLNLTSYRMAKMSGFLNGNRIIEKLHEINQGVLSEGGPTYKIYDDDFLSTKGPNKFKLIKAYFKGLAYFMFVPFPWVLPSKMQIMMYPQMIIWYLILPFGLIGMLFAVRYRLKISFALICYIFLGSLGCALVEGNVATVLRHRDVILIFYFIFSAAGLVKVFDSKTLLIDSERSW